MENSSSSSELQKLIEAIKILEIDLSYYDLFGSLKLVLLNGSKLPSKQEALKESVIEIFNCKESEFAYPWVEKVIMGQSICRHQICSSNLKPCSKVFL